jgi:hypothetical protein
MLITFCDEFLQQNQQDREVVHSFRREMFSFVYSASVTSILLTVQSNEQTCSIIASQYSIGPLLSLWLRNIGRGHHDTLPMDR